MSRKNKLKKLGRRRQRSQSISRQQLSPFDAGNRFKNVILLSYDISYEPLGRLSPEWSAIESIDSAEIDRVGPLVYSDPAGAIEPIRLMLDKHPDTAILVQWLINALEQTGQDTEADRLIELNYHNHPDYLFARLHYAMLLLRRGELDTVEKMFEKKMELKLLYPERNVFHISEVLGFNAFAVQFFIRSGKLQHAEPYLKVLEQLAPDEPNTKICESMLNHARFLQSLKRIGHKMLGHGWLSRNG